MFTCLKLVYLLVHCMMPEAEHLLQHRDRACHSERRGSRPVAAELCWYRACDCSIPGSIVEEAWVQLPNDYLQAFNQICKS